MPRASPAARSPPRYPASTVQLASTWPDGPETSSPSWLRPSVLRADAADNPGFGGDRMEALLDQPRIAQRLLPELGRGRALRSDAQAVAGQVLRDAPPSADSLGGQRGGFLAQDGTVAR